MSNNSTFKEQSLNPTTSGDLQLKPAVKQTEPADLDERIWLALASAAEKKALHTVVLDLREVASFTDYFIITGGANERQVQAISDEVVETLKKSGAPVIRVEGYKTAEWILLDCGDFVMHIFGEKSRTFYDLERLWRAAKQVELPAEFSSELSSSLRSES